MPLQDTLDAMRASFEAKLPPEIVATMHHATEALLQSGIMDRVLKAGDQAPPFALPDHNGDMVGSEELLRKGPLVVSFYRGDLSWIVTARLSMSMCTRITRSGWNQLISSTY